MSDMSDCEEEEEEWKIEDICGHIRKSELIKNGNELPYDEDDLRDSKSAFAFRVKWEGFDGNDTWQSYESLKGDKKKAKHYARLHGIEIVSDEQMKSGSDNTDEGYLVDEICGHIRTTELLKEGRKEDIPFTTEELRESECEYAFRVKWVGYEGEDTWQSYESLNDEKRRARDYARLHSLELFPNKKQVFNREEEIELVRAIEERYKNRESSGSRAPPSTSKENKQMHKDTTSMKKHGKNPLITLSSEDEEERKNKKYYEEEKIKKTKDMKMAKTTPSSSRVIVYPNVQGLKIHLHNEESAPKDKNNNKSKMDSQAYKMQMKRVESARLDKDSKESRKRYKKKEYSESDSDSDVSPIKKKRDSNEGHKSQHERMEVRRSNEKVKEEKRYKSSDDKSPKERMIKTQRKKIQESSSDESDEEGMEWEKEKIINHVTVRQVRQGREIEGRERLNWKRIEKSQLPIIFRVSFIGDGWKKRFEWQTIEELDDLPTLDKYLHTAKLDLPKNYASMMKKTKKVVDDDDIFAAD